MKRIYDELNCHDWENQETTFSDTPIDVSNPPPFEERAKNGTALSRYCKICGQSEVYHGTDKKWIKTGVINFKN